MKTNRKILYLTQLGLLTAITILLNFTPLGFLRIGVVEITFMAIPVIIGGAVLGPAAGAFLGLVFGICSFSLAPTHPLFSIVLAENPVVLALVCVVPRILVGVVAAYIVNIFEKIVKFRPVSYFLAGLAGALTNTVLFLSGIVFLMEQTITPKMAEFGLLSEKTFVGFWVGIGVVNGVPEALACTILCGAIILPLKKFVMKPAV